MSESSSQGPIRREKNEIEVLVTKAIRGRILRLTEKTRLYPGALSPDNGLRNLVFDDYPRLKDAQEHHGNDSIFHLETHTVGGTTAYVILHLSERCKPAGYEGPTKFLFTSKT